MDTHEIVQLARWFTEAHEKLTQAFQPLQQAFQHNSHNQQRVPTSPHLNDLESYLSEIDFSLISNQQMELLQKLNLYEYIGPNAAITFTKELKDFAFDPPTALQKIDHAMEQIDNANTIFRQLLQTLNSVGVDTKQTESKPDVMLMRVQFKGDTAINDMTSLKTKSLDWYHIIRGLSLGIGARLEDIEIVTVSKRSPFLLDLAISYALVKTISSIVTAIADCTLNILKIRLALSQLEKEKLLTETIRNDLRRQEKQLNDKGLITIKQQSKGLFPEGGNEEHLAAIEKAIERLFDFYQKGGEVDFPSPLQEVTENGHPKKLSKVTRDTYEAIRSFRDKRNEVRKLENKTQVGENTGK